jgi:hypothetical protein
MEPHMAQYVDMEQHMEQQMEQYMEQQINMLRIFYAITNLENRATILH